MDLLSTYQKERSGIYKITIGQKHYIGSSVDVFVRWKNHKRDLKKGVHKNNIMQALFNKYGVDLFNFEVVEFCSKSDLLIREQYYIDTTNPYINIHKVAGSSLGAKFSDEIKLKFRNSQGKRVYQYSLDGMFIKEWRNSKFASDEYKIDHTGILKCCSGLFKSFQGYIWSHKKEDNVAKYINSKLKKVNQYDKDFNFVAEYTSVLSAAQTLGIRQSFISRVCNEKKGKVKGFYFSFVDCPLEDIMQNNAQRPIFVYDRKGNFIKEYQCREKLCNDFNLKSDSVARYLNSEKGKSYKGLILSYDRITS